MLITADALKADYAEDHFTCEDDISRNGGEMFIVDRTSMQNPLKILDIPVIKYWYGKLQTQSLQINCLQLFLYVAWVSEVISADNRGIQRNIV